MADTPADPFAAVRPIARTAGRALVAQAERAYVHAHRNHETTPAVTPAAGRTRRARPTSSPFPALTRDDLIGMTAKLIDDFWHDGQQDPVSGTTPRPSERKQLATGYAILVDKWTILKGLPTVIHGFSADEESARPAVQALIRSLAALPTTPTPR